MTAPPAGARVWYRPTMPGYGYADRIPAVVVQRTQRVGFCRIALLTCGGAGSLVTITTKGSRLEPRDEAARVDNERRTA